MAMDIQGKLIKIMAPVTGEGRTGAWTKQEFIIETADQYPKKVCISAWSDKISQIQRFQVGDDIRVSVNPESREYNERWYTELRAWKIDPVGSGAPHSGSYQNQAAPASHSAAPSTSGADFQTAPVASDSFLSGGDDTDLPF
ncbi:MAG: DUF3127 domain-containing protein [Bacteroidia bacterium]|nr:DUF3127 domain-containing protein [Bacteroidia bacterium]